MERHAAVVAGTKSNAFATEDFREVVGVDAFEGEGDTAMNEVPGSGFWVLRWSKKLESGDGLQWQMADR
jgi:hypothetical protein